jgi:hypothetical protein
MEEKKKDMREIPIPQWPTRTITSKLSGQWAVFFQGEEDAPIVNPESCIGMEYITNPRTDRPASTCLNELAKLTATQRPRAETTLGRPLDSFTLHRMRRQKEADDQRLGVEGAATLVGTGETVPALGRSWRRFGQTAQSPINVDVPAVSPFHNVGMKAPPRIRPRPNKRVPVPLCPRFGKKVRNFFVED